MTTTIGRSRTVVSPGVGRPLNKHRTTARSAWQTPSRLQPSRAFPIGSRLHVGCGPRRLRGWVNADAVAGVGDVVLDLHDELPGNTFREVYGCHVLEHCWPEDTPRILKSLHDALLPGGTLRLSVPDIRLVVKNCVDGHAYGDERSALAVIYGGSFSRTTTSPDLHRQTFWRERLEALLKGAGFVNVRPWRRGQYPAIDELGDYATRPADAAGQSLISLNLEADRAGDLVKLETSGAAIDVSVVLGTVDRPEMLKECVEAVRSSLGGVTYEIVVAYGRADEPSLPWLREQKDVVPVLGGMAGAIEAFNRAYTVSRGRLVCQINDDVIVDGDAIARAVRHLDADPTASGVVFKFDRGDGQGYRHERIAGNALHPNQMVVRREACEAVVERIGAFWGSEQHRTDKTYGGDSAFGVVCKHLGLRLDSVEGVTCRDLLAADALRAQNAASVSKTHGSRWGAMYAPMMNSAASTPTAEEWPNLYVPRTGAAQRRSPISAGAPLRLLHLSLRRDKEPQAGIRRALAQIGPTVEVPWLGREQAAISMAREHQPDLIFAQVHSDDWRHEVTRALRSVAPGAVLCMWTGDVRTKSSERVAPWLARAGQEFDIVLASNTTYPKKLKLEERATAACGFMPCGADLQEVGGEATGPETDGAAFFGMNYIGLDGGNRLRLFAEAAESCTLRLYGGGWENSSLEHLARPYLPKSRAASVVRQTPVTIATSLYHDLGRYSSDRLSWSVCAGGVVAVRKFADMEGFGLRHGENCLVWSSPGELVKILKDWTRPLRAADRAVIRRNASALGRQRMTWDVVVEGLLAIVRDYRARTGRC